MWLAYWTWNEAGESSWDPCICSSRAEVKAFHENTKDKYRRKSVSYFSVHLISGPLPPADVTDILTQ